jgi:hypothetical protein
MAYRSVSLQRKNRQEMREFQLNYLKQTLRLAKRILENPPSIGFDHAPQPDLGIDEVTKALATKGLLPAASVPSVMRARDALLEVDQAIAETKAPGFEHSMSTRFRQRFPEIRTRALPVLDEALKAIERIS